MYLWTGTEKGSVRPFGPYGKTVHKTGLTAKLVKEVRPWFRSRFNAWRKYDEECVSGARGEYQSYEGRRWESQSSK